MDTKYHDMIKIDIPRHNVEVHAGVLKIKFKLYGDEEKYVWFIIGSKYGFLKKRPDGGGYFTILLKPNMTYSYYTEDIINGCREVRRDGHNLSKLILEGIKYEKEMYN